MSSTSAFADWAILYRAPKVLVLAPSTFCWAQALAGAATEVHFPAIGFFHGQHNVRAPRPRLPTRAVKCPRADL